jgi:hypothetical protein
MKSKVYGRKIDAQDELLRLILDVIICIKYHKDAPRQVTRHVLTRVAKSIEADGKTF